MSGEFRNICGNCSKVFFSKGDYKDCCPECGGPKYVEVSPTSKTYLLPWANIKDITDFLKTQTQFASSTIVAANREDLSYFEYILPKEWEDISQFAIVTANYT